jgi:hypothetical protein
VVDPEETRVGHRRKESRNNLPESCEVWNSEEESRKRKLAKPVKKPTLRNTV